MRVRSAGSYHSPCDCTLLPQRSGVSVLPGAGLGSTFRADPRLRLAIMHSSCPEGQDRHRESMTGGRDGAGTRAPCAGPANADAERREAPVGPVRSAPIVAFFGVGTGLRGRARGGRANYGTWG